MDALHVIRPSTEWFKLFDLLYYLPMIAANNNVNNTTVYQVLSINKKTTYTK